MKYLKIFTISVLLITYSNLVLAADIYFIDMKKILNESKAGKSAQNFLKKKFDSESKKFEKEASVLKKQETDLIAKKKLVSPEEYKKTLSDLRNKSLDYQKRKRKSQNEWVQKKNEARTKLISATNPILQKYMSENKIEMVVDKKYILLANSNFELTDVILKILDKEVKSINLN